jgi:hypothetical protein
MAARELNEIDREIFELRQFVEAQQLLIQQLTGAGNTEFLLQAQEALRPLEEKLQELMVRRKVILEGLRRARTSSGENSAGGSP